MGLSDLAWVLDDGPLDMLAAEVGPSQLREWPAGVLFVAGATAEASMEPGSRRRAALTTESSRGRLVIESFEIRVTSRAGDVLYQHLRKSSGITAANLAEHQTIAWAVTEKEQAVFVTPDKAAASLALAELGRSRVCHPVEFWKNLLDDGMITDLQWQALLRRSLREDRSLPGVPWRYQSAS